MWKSEKLPLKFYEQEEREGFRVGEVMKRAWAAELKALSDIDSFCRKNSITYFAVYGTLLGTVRHGGFIPWDDDIDIGMVRDDYIKFLELFPTAGKGEYQVYNPYTKPWYCMNFTHVVNGRDMSFTRGHLKEWHGCPFLVGPDIYPYYYIPRAKEEEEYIMLMLERVDSAIALARQSAAGMRSGANDEHERQRELLAAVLVGLEHETGYNFSTDRPLDNQLEILYDQICRLTTREEADYLTRYDEYAKDRRKKFPKDWLEHVVELPFEWGTMPVPVTYDALLKARFGDGFMMPAREPALHGYPFFRKQMTEVGNIFEERERQQFTNGGGEIGAVGDGRIKVLYYTSVREMLIHSESVEDKLNEVISFFRTRRKELCLWWIPGSFIDVDDLAMPETAPLMTAFYEEKIKEFTHEGFGICDRSGDYDRAVEHGDLFFGDEGIVSAAFAKSGGKVIIQQYGEKENDVLLSLLD